MDKTQDANTLLDPYTLTKGDEIRVLIPEQYSDGAMYLSGEPTPVRSCTAARVISGTFQGMPGATSGFFF